MTPALEAKALSVAYGAFVAVEKVDLAVAPRTVHSIIGPNGAGKTTLFNALSGTVRASGGEIAFQGRRVDRLPASRRVALGIARSFQVTNLFVEQSVTENARLAVQAARRWRGFDFWSPVAGHPAIEAAVVAVLRRVGLEDRATARAGELSHGEQRRLEIALALAGNPTLLFLDEPTAGMGVEDIAFVKALVQRLVAEDGLTIVLIEHNMSLVMDISRTITVLQQGRKIAEGVPEAIRADPLVRKAYLGE